MDNRRDFALLHPFMRSNKAIHKSLQILRLRTDKMDNLILIGDGLPDIVLTDTVIALFESRINNPVLKF